MCHGRLVGVRGQSFGEGFLFPFLWVLELELGPPGLLAKHLFAGFTIREVGSW